MSRRLHRNTYCSEGHTQLHGMSAMFCSISLLVVQSNLPCYRTGVVQLSCNNLVYSSWNTFFTVYDRVYENGPFSIIINFEVKVDFY